MYNDACEAISETDRAEFDSVKTQALLDNANELAAAAEMYAVDARKIRAAMMNFNEKFAAALPKTNGDQHNVRKRFDSTADSIRGLVKQVDLLHKLASRVVDQASDLAADEAISVVYDRRAASRALRQLDDERKAAVDQLKQTAYFHRQVAWLQDRFPHAKLQHVPGLVKVVCRTEIEAADWSLSPARYVGMAPPEEDEDFDFEQTLRDIHTELADLNHEAVELASTIQHNFEDLGI